MSGELGRAAMLVALVAVAGCKGSRPAGDDAPQPAATPSEGAETAKAPKTPPAAPADACAPEVAPLAVDESVCAAYVERLRALPALAAAPAGERGVAEHLADFPRTPAWTRALLEECEISGLATVGPLLVEAARGCPAAEEVLEQIAKASRTGLETLGLASAEALEACDCSLAATDGFVSLLVYVMRPRQTGEEASPP